MDLCVVVLLFCIFQLIHGQPDDQGALKLTLADFLCSDHNQLKAASVISSAT
jgi:hypothetical protein